MDDEALFRREAIAHRTDRLLGGVVLLRPISFTLVSAFASAIAAALLALLLLGSYARKETVVGHIAPAGGLIKILPAQPGIVERSPLREGQRVTAGDTLFVISTRRSDERDRDVDARIIEEVGAERRALSTQLVRQSELHDVEIRASVQKAADTRSQLELLERRRASFDERVARREKMLERLTPAAAAGHVPRMQLEEGEAALLEARIARQDLDQEMSRLASVLRAQKHEQTSLPSRHAIDVAELEKALSAVDQRLAEAGTRLGYALRAPVSGRIGSLQGHAGMSVVPGRPLAALIPAGAELRAELFVPARAIGFLEAGQRVRLRYDAYPYQKFGLYEGVVTGIGRSILLPEEMQGPATLREPAYRVTVGLARQSASVYGRELPLKPGMTLEADIIRDRRQIIEWLFEPVYSAVGRRR
ncbi:MAG: HlyD family efflux transporter periplasmic adaptor subunit [Gammaproteobacteria bacterium]|nr:HlyD family efflux transporter periplasmic adaptor subunit [Gammaproteobacteria bacterium]